MAPVDPPPSDRSRKRADPTSQRAKRPRRLFKLHVANTPGDWACRHADPTSEDERVTAVIFEKKWEA